ncbi:hypothetical protein FEM48_Zijuj11G0156000 [Ziziphus jujuba var. spinosa]|uniref:SH3 domain-containing protein n=1 Tax=Ziziphus jujuba var. spinosa TaxID=714518 RepID=A0A978UJS9_ZIZJJ|nr:hypothetical protein FEM48_Zijuj11G0156000 [Ziziphus jujuba var. spinosa]
MNLRIRALTLLLQELLSTLVCELLWTQINGAPLEDARHLVYCYDKLRQDVEAQVTEVLRRRSKTRDLSMSCKSSVKLQSAEAKLADLKSFTVALGREATAVMLSVNAERSYHQHALGILEKLHAEVVHQCDAKAEGELSLSVDDYVVVRQVAPHGWSEGECNGKAGWFPSAYIERQEKAPTSKIAHSSL